MSTSTIEARRATEDAVGYYIDTMDDKLAPLVGDVLDQVDDIDLSEPYPEDQATEIADQSVPTYTGDIFELMPALQGYTISDPGLMPPNASLERTAEIMVYDILSNVAHQRLYARQQNAE